jgi:glucan phosphoethanolaminetransferase (alkaline phosphatase superfamily)
MAGVCLVISNMLKTEVNLQAGVMERAYNLGFCVFGGLFSYLVFCLILRVKEAKELWNWLVKSKCRVNK